jgi:Zn-dependent protease with chaperone function
MEHRVNELERELKPLISRELRWWTWKRVLLASIIILVFLEIGTYAFNWTWTGFKDNNTLWDWLQLLLLPIALAAVPIWFMAEENQQRLWLAQMKWVLLGVAIVLAVLFIGTFAYGWRWTGFRDHGRVWDWLGLLLVPVIVAVLPIWYSIRMSQQRSRARSGQ